MLADIDTYIYNFVRYTPHHLSVQNGEVRLFTRSGELQQHAKEAGFLPHGSHPSYLYLRCLLQTTSI